MGAEEVQVDLAMNWSESDFNFDDELSRGLDISLEELEQEQGLLTVRGRQVLLFIPDHGHRFQNTLLDRTKGNKFHVADCEQLDKMRQRRRFDRYKVTNDISGVFQIYGLGEDANHTEADVSLCACKYCLKMLNYKGAATMNLKGRDHLASNMDLSEFFSTYGSIFKTLPKQISSRSQSGYSDDWPQISQKIRHSVNYLCQHCKVDLSNDKRLLHVHHYNGIKSDNSPNNLVALCADCHRKEPFHEHMHVKHETVQHINHLRREQGLLDGTDWDKTLKLSDPAVYGVLDLCKYKRMHPPEVGYELLNDKNEIVAELELAWPEIRMGVYISEVEAVAGWQLFDIQEALKYFGSKR